MREISFEVAGLPPIKNEARSLFSPGHGHASAVSALLMAARGALDGAAWNSETTVALALLVEIQTDQSTIGDLTNYLGGIADVLEYKGRRGTLDHLGDLSIVHLYRNDAQIQEVHATRAKGTSAYRVTLREFDFVKRERRHRSFRRSTCIC